MIELLKNEFIQDKQDDLYKIDTVTEITSL